MVHVIYETVPISLILAKRKRDINVVAPPPYATILLSTLPFRACLYFLGDVVTDLEIQMPILRGNYMQYVI